MDKQDKTSIGTLSEKSVHSVLKDYIEPNKERQEVKIGRYIADIKQDNEVIEIQTQQFKKLIPKINYYNSIGLKTTIIYPLIHRKTICWINPIDHRLIEEKKSTKIGRLQDIFKELYWIVDYIESKQIDLKIISLDVKEYKLLDGYGHNNKKRATKVDKIPTNINETITISSIDDLKKLIPETLKNKEWTAKEYIKEVKSNNRYIGSGLKMLREKGVIQVVRKEGNSFIYKA